MIEVEAHYSIGTYLVLSDGVPVGRVAPIDDGLDYSSQGWVAIPQGRVPFNVYGSLKRAAYECANGTMVWEYLPRFEDVKVH